MTLGEYFGTIGIIAALLLPLALESALPFVDTSLFTSWRRRKPIVLIGVVMMVAYAILGFMSMLPNPVLAGSTAGTAVNLTPAFTYREFPWIISSIIISGLAGLYLLRKRKPAGKNEA